MDAIFMTAFDSEFFRGTWDYVYRPQAHGEGFEPREPIKSGITVDAICKTCGDPALANVATGSVQLKCRRCVLSKTVERTELDRRAP